MLEKLEEKGRRAVLFRRHMAAPDLGKKKKKKKKKKSKADRTICDIDTRAKNPRVHLVP